ncbi:hypothetical protein C3489_20130 [Streptomyces sp. Ru71]|uniref:DUF6777 domain-containing protein n=1 Tax=Streptomyces sp. Ru71 TaxID=2080746 RepID=UPI000CDDF572|nr:DUF6777 domain-containing protein [Streptomyces sp. Ru71]POX51293.1 hypothetical protein C3489_20130 [Streptomyces sp. Ru71]
MSVEPPSSGRPSGPPNSSGRPTGPPSGPLSGPGGPAQPPPSGPPSQPTGGASQAPEPRRPWWKSAPRIAVIATLIVAAVVVAVVLGRSGGGGGGSGTHGEVFLQAAGKTGPDPFTPSTATDSSVPPVSPAPASASAPVNAVRGVDGSAPGLYGGTRERSACDVERQIRYLTAEPEKNRAFAAVAGVPPAQVPAYLRSLTPVQLRMDTRVTNHGYHEGAATSYQAVLQAGTAVLVDAHGSPSVRCACGNPLTPPVAQQGTVVRTGDSWPGYNPSNVVAVAPSTRVITVFVLYDPDHHAWIARHRGDTGEHDRKTHPPAKPTPSTSVSTSVGPTTPVPVTSSTSAPSSPSSQGSTTPTSEEAPSSPPPSSEPLVPEPASSAPASSEQPPSS